MNPTNLNAELRAQIEADVATFLALGNTVTEIPRGTSAHNFTQIQTAEGPRYVCEKTGKLYGGTMHLRSKKRNPK